MTNADIASTIDASKTPIADTIAELVQDGLATWCRVMGDYFVAGTTIWGPGDVPDLIRGLIDFDEETNEICWTSLDGYPVRMPQGTMVFWHWLPDGSFAIYCDEDWERSFEGDMRHDCFKLREGSPVTWVPCTQEALEALSKVCGSYLCQDEAGNWSILMPWGAESLTVEDRLVVLRTYEEDGYVWVMIAQKGDELEQHLACDPGIVYVA